MLKYVRYMQYIHTGYIAKLASYIAKQASLVWSRARSIEPHAFFAQQIYNKPLRAFQPKHE